MKNVLKTIAILILLSAIVNAQSNTKINVMADFNSPMDDMGDMYKTGFGGNAGLSYKLSDGWDLGLSVGYAKWSADSDYYSKIISELSGTEVNVDVDMPYTAVPVMLDVYYYFSRKSFQPYLTLSLGAHFTTVDANSITVEGKEFNFGASESNTVAGYKLGAGFLYAFSPKVALNILAAMGGNSLEFEQATTEIDGNTATSNSSNTTTAYFNISAGISISL